MESDGSWEVMEYDGADEVDPLRCAVVVDVTVHVRGGDVGPIVKQRGTMQQVGM